jgi:cell division initiation protein
MELTPNDIRNYEFQTQMRGYDKDEVDSLVKRLAELFDQLKQDNLKFSMENDSLKSQLESLKELEETIKNATIDARKNADALMTNAKEEATKIVEEAKAEARELIGNKQEEHDTLERKIKQLEETRKSFLDNLQGLISSHLSQLESTPPPAKSSTYEQAEEVKTVEDMSQEMLENLSENIEDDDDSSVHDATNEEETEVEATEYDEPEEFDDETEGLDPELASTANNYEHVSSEDVEGPASSQVDETPVSSPVNEVPVSSQFDEVPVSSQVDEVPVSSQVEEVPVSSPVDEVPASSQFDEVPVSSPVDEVPVSSLVEEVSVNSLVNVVETNKTAEEVPEGFIVQDPQYENTNDTIPVGEEPEPATTEPEIDPLSPEGLAATLDSVVARFEEEMDKADKS